MDWKKNRVGLAAALLVVASAGVVWASRQQGASDSAGAAAPVELPEFEVDDADALVITRVDKPEVAFEKRDGTWHMVKPTPADADEGSVTAALEKLAELEHGSVVSEKAELHERLGVTADKATHAVAKRGDEVLADLWIGPYKSAGTLVRVDGQDAVVAVKGSIGYPFDKDVHLYRDREITELETARVEALETVHGETTYRFVKPAPDGDWQLAEGQEAVEEFDPAQVKSLVSSFSRLRASGFDEPEASEEARGLSEPAAVVKLTLGATEEGGEAEVVELRLGTKDEESGDYAVMRVGSDVPYRISEFNAHKLEVDAEDLKKKEAPPAAPGGHGMPIAGGGPNGQQLPPEVMKQLQQMQQQQGH